MLSVHCTAEAHMFFFCTVCHSPQHQNMAPKNQAALSVILVESCERRHSHSEMPLSHRGRMLGSFTGHAVNMNPPVGSIWPFVLSLSRGRITQYHRKKATAPAAAATITRKKKTNPAGSPLPGLFVFINTETRLVPLMSDLIYITEVLCAY